VKRIKVADVRAVRTPLYELEDEVGREKRRGEESSGTDEEEEASGSVKEEEQARVNALAHKYAEPGGLEAATSSQEEMQSGPSSARESPSPETTRSSIRYVFNSSPHNNNNYQPRPQAASYSKRSHEHDSESDEGEGN
jgi:hypothetical protein